MSIFENIHLITFYLYYLNEVNNLLTFVFCCFLPAITTMPTSTSTTNVITTMNSTITAAVVCQSDLGGMITSGGGFSVNNPR
jgi:hypothetical protein